MIKIAICDDEMAYVEKIATLVTKSFDKEMFSVSKFYDGEKLLETDIVSYDLIFLDVDMKNLNGIDVAKQIRKCNKKV
ncbi:MAG: response regulator, partial [Oscillospiraceae bacterium]